MITSAELSKYRQHLSQLIKTIDKLAYQCAHADPLIQGTPGEVFRTCGQKNCKCASDRNARQQFLLKDSLRSCQEVKNWGK